MARTGMATAVGTAVLFYLVLSGRLSTAAVDEERRLLSGAAAEAAAAARERRRRKAEARERRRRARRRLKWPERAPGSWSEAARVAARTVKFTYGETLGKWHLGEIAFGIKYYMKQQGDLQHEYAQSDSSRLLKGPEVLQQLTELLKYLKLCMFFSKKPYEVFLELAGLCQDDVLIQKSKGRLLKPSFTVVHDGNNKCLLLFIRGAISVRDRLTAATGLNVPFHHVVTKEGCDSNVVLGYAHCGMVVAARWIAKQAIPILTGAVDSFPDHDIKIIGHSMGAGIASILTIILRENEKLASTKCIAYAPAACMTWELAESGKEFITTLVNKNDVVPSFSRVSVANLRKEVTASSWIPDLREQIQRTRFLGCVNRSVSFMRSHLPFVSNPKSKVVDADILLQSASEAEMKQSADPPKAKGKKRPTFSCWSCFTPNNQTIDSDDDLDEGHVSGTAVESAKKTPDEDADKTKDETGAAEPISDTADIAKELTDHEEYTEEKEPNAAKETDINPLEEADDDKPGPSGAEEVHQLYPPGRIMHMLVLPVPASASSEEGEVQEESVSVGVYETARELYSKVRLARLMIREHYMPRYIQTLELLIDKLESEVSETGGS